MTETDPSVAKRLDDAASARGEAGYVDPETGYFVMTSHHLKSRGACCGSGCRHCPYDANEQSTAGRPKERNRGV